MVASSTRSEQTSPNSSVLLVVFALVVSLEDLLHTAYGMGMYIQYEQQRWMHHSINPSTPKSADSIAQWRVEDTELLALGCWDFLNHSRPIKY